MIIFLMRSNLLLILINIFNFIIFYYYLLLNDSKKIIFNYLKDNFFNYKILIKNLIIV